MVITLCGSPKFLNEFLEVSKILSLNGYLVLTPPLYENPLSVEQEELFVSMQQQSIELSDAIYIINNDGFQDELTNRLIKFAKELNKKIYYAFVLCHPDCCYRDLKLCRALTVLHDFKYSFNKNFLPDCDYPTIQDKE
jgi:hypothetical protein